MKLVEKCTEQTAWLAPLLTKQDVARLLAVSTRTVDRLKDGGRMPKPFMVGGNCRWRPEALEEWVAGGCKPVR